jgi:hypothetical protein
MKLTKFQLLIALLELPRQDLFNLLSQPHIQRDLQQRHKEQEVICTFNIEPPKSRGKYRVELKLDSYSLLRDFHGFVPVRYFEQYGDAVNCFNELVSLRSEGNTSNMFDFLRCQATSEENIKLITAFLFDQEIHFP